jgi:hypothetical protein
MKQIHSRKMLDVPMTALSVWTLEDWASAIEALPVAGGLPERLVLVPNQRVAHALRRALIERGAPSALIGTRFLTLLQVACEVVRDAGEQASAPNDREIGPTLARRAFSQVELSRFIREDLLELPGWDAAFATTLRELEGALLSPDVLMRSPDPHVADVGRIYAALQARSELVSAGSILQRAAVLAGAAVRQIPTLAVVTGFESLAEVALLRALPGLTWAHWPVRPQREELTQRSRSLLGSPAPLGRGEHTAQSALQHLQYALFDQLAGVRAPQDDSVRIAIYAGVHEEVEAAVSWVIEQVLEHGVPAHDIAILSASAEPYASLLRARLAALPWPEAREPAIAERGVTLAERPDGARLLIAIRALRQGLSRDALAALLPILRGEGDDFRVRGSSHAWDLLNTLAANGGERTKLAAGCSWDDALQRSLARLDSPAPKSGGLEERERLHRAELRNDLAALAPSIQALTDVLRAVVSGEGLCELWERLASFADAHLKLPPCVPPVSSLLQRACLQFSEHRNLEPTGDDALVWLEDALCDSAVKTGRFGTPAVHLGTLSGVRGLSFRAVRVVGLVEGAVPSAVREDPVLPDAMRASLSPFLLTSRQRAHQQLAAFDDAVRAARLRLALSAPRVSVEGSVRQPATVLLEVVRALSGSNSGLEGKLDDFARAGRARERALRERYPVSRAATLERIARGDVALADSDSNPALSLQALSAIRDRTMPTAQDGLLAGVLPPESVAGLHSARPISATRLSALLSCPHRFLYENLLGFREPVGASQSHSLDALTFGKWLHGIAEHFWQEHGEAFGKRDGSLSGHADALRSLASEHFEELRQTYPFANDSVANAAREALCDQLNKLLTLDWNGAQPRTFVGVERGFGYDSPCTLETAAGPLHLRGKIDKLDREGDTLLVRDIKTAAGKPRGADDEPDLDIDLQLAVYAVVAKHMASTWHTPDDVGVAYIYLRHGESDRSWIGADYARLEVVAREWLATARETLQQGAFVRSPIAQDCRYCAHKPVCAPEMHRAQDVLADPRVPRRLALLKAGESNE